MLRLMKLELKKFKFGWYVRGAVIANIIILALLIFVSFIAQIEGDSEIKSQMILLMASTVVRATFIIFGSVLIARLIIGEYKIKQYYSCFLILLTERK